MRGEGREGAHGSAICPCHRKPIEATDDTAVAALGSDKHSGRKRRGSLVGALLSGGEGIGFVSVAGNVVRPARPSRWVARRLLPEGAADIVILVRVKHPPFSRRPTRAEEG